MPTSNKLTDTQCKRAAATGGPLKLFDGHGLYLFVTGAGGKRWRMAYRLDGKPQTATFGPYPRVSLAQARSLRDELLRKLDSGADPRQAAKALSLTLEQACSRYWQGRKDVSDGYRNHALRGLAMHLWPRLGAVPVGDITRDMLLAQLQRMDAAGRHVYVRRVRVWVSQVFDWAVEHGHASVNAAALINPEKAFSRATVEPMAALPLVEIPEFMARLSFERDLQSVLACKMLALTWVRTKELRQMRWGQIEADVWRVPADAMKKRREHLVPLSSQALQLLQVLHARRRGELVFVSDLREDRAISENAILYLMARMGYKGRMTGHGWRSVGSTWANEAGYSPDAIEVQLAHAPDNAIRAVYNRAQYMPQRRAMLQAWADWLMPPSETRSQQAAAAQS